MEPAEVSLKIQKRYPGKKKQDTLLIKHELEFYELI